MPSMKEMKFHLSVVTFNLSLCASSHKHELIEIYTFVTGKQTTTVPKPSTPTKIHKMLLHVFKVVNGK